MLIVGGGYADIPLIQSAKNIGFHVITTGNRPSDLGHTYSHVYHNEDFSDCEAILKLAKELKVDAICPSCNDFAALSAAYAAEELGLPGHDSYETSQIIHHKDKYREFAQANNIPSPSAIGGISTEDIMGSIDSLVFPVIIKPVDLSGGKGIAMADSKEEVFTAVEKAFNISKAKRVVVEEFITGSRHGFSAFLYKGKIGFYFSDNEHYYLNPYMVSAASSPSIVSKDIERKLCYELEKIAALLTLADGILHVQYILKDDTPFIIEICRRAPGDLYIKFVQHATGVDYPSWIVKASAGIDCSNLSYCDTKGYFTRHCVMAERHGNIKDVVFDKLIEKNIIDKLMWWSKGDEIVNVLTEKLGIVFLKFDSAERMLSVTNDLNELIVVHTE